LSHSNSIFFYFLSVFLLLLPFVILVICDFSFSTTNFHPPLSADFQFFVHHNNFIVVCFYFYCFILGYFVAILMLFMISSLPHSFFLTVLLDFKTLGDFLDYFIYFLLICFLDSWGWDPGPCIC
jgi:hypothetical protein